MTGLAFALWLVLAVVPPVWVFLMAFYGDWQWPHCIGNRIEED